MSGSGTARTRRLGAVGTLVWDRIWHPSGEGAVEQWGGMTYSLASLSATCPAGWEVEPIVKVGADRATPAAAHLRSLPNVVVGGGMRVVAEPNNQVELRYLDVDHRTERQLGGVPGWTWPEMEPLLPHLDALYVNFLSGYEMDLDTVRRVRDAFAGPMYADLHSLFLSPPGDRPRVGRPLPRWEEWLACFDVVQLNEAEVELLTGEHPPTDAVLGGPLDRGPRLVLVTRGAAGARFAARPGLGTDPTSWRAAAPEPGVCAGEVPQPAALLGDPTGCGDVWGSACFTGLLAGLPLREAVARAHAAAAVKIRRPATAVLHRALLEDL